MHVVEGVVDRAVATVVDVNTKGVERRPELLDVVGRGAGRHTHRAPPFEPAHDGLITCRVRRVNGTERLADGEGEEIGHATALSRIGRAAKAAPLIEHEAIGGDGPIPPDLGTLPTHLLVEGD